MVTWDGSLEYFTFSLLAASLHTALFPATTANRVQLNSFSSDTTDFDTFQLDGIVRANVGNLVTSYATFESRQLCGKKNKTNNLHNWVAQTSATIASHETITRGLEHCSDKHDVKINRIRWKRRDVIGWIAPLIGRATFQSSRYDILFGQWEVAISKQITNILKSSLFWGRQIRFKHGAKMCWIQHDSRLSSDPCFRANSINYSNRVTRESFDVCSWVTCFSLNNRSIFSTGTDARCGAGVQEIT